MRALHLLCGTEIAFIHGHDLTGSSVADLQPKTYADLVWRQYEEILVERVPHIYANQSGTDAPRSRQVVLHLPFSSDGTDIDVVMAVDAYSGDKRDLSRLFESRVA